MKNTLLLFCILFLLSACKKDTPEQSNNTKADDPRAMITNLLKQVDANPKDAKTATGNFAKIAQISVEQKSFTQAINMLKRSLKEYGLIPENEANASLMAGIFANNLKDNETAISVYQGIASAYPNNAKAKTAIPAGTAPLSERIVDISKKMYNDSTHRIEPAIAGKYINATEIMALLKPEDPSAASSLFKAGETARTMRQFPKALEIYDWILEKYPSYEKASQALFLKGFTLDNDLSKPTEAKEIYQAFLQKYPKDDFADDTQFLLKNLGKSDEDIIKSFEKK